MSGHPEVRVSDPNATGQEDFDDGYTAGLRAGHEDALRSPIGWVVLCPEGLALVPNWDGEVHRDRDDADHELAACRAAGYEGDLYAVFPVNP